MIQSPSTKNSAWSTACETIRDLMNLQRDFLQYIIHLQKHLTISSPLLPPKYSRSSDWMTLFLIETRNNGSQNNHTVRQKYHIHPKSDERFGGERSGSHAVLQWSPGPKWGRKTVCSANGGVASKQVPKSTKGNKEMTNNWRFFFCVCLIFYV